MSKEVKRYDPFGYDGLSALMHEDVLGDYVRHEDYEALLAERDARLLQIDTLAEWYSNSLDVINEITAALPGAHYMDPPDGGDVSVPEQVRRMAKDAERYRWLREFIDQSPQAIEHLACSDGDLIDDVIDAALQGAQP